jgi:endonuclease-3
MASRHHMAGEHPATANVYWSDTMARESKAAKGARALNILAQLERTYPDADCALNWRTPFELLIAAILSAQSTDERVNMITPELFRAYPNPAALATATQAAVERHIKTLGLFRNKAKNIRALAAELMERFDGEVPQTMEELTSLPGVARKTANVLLGTAFGQASGVVVDTHVLRLAQRMGFSKKTKARMPTQKERDQIEQDLMVLFPQDKWVFVGHALILHGRQICTARSPNCDGCPVNDLCPKRI